MRVTAGDLGLCCCTCAPYFERQLAPLCVYSVKFSQQNETVLQNNEPLKGLRRHRQQQQTNKQTKIQKTVQHGVWFLPLLFHSALSRKLQIYLNGPSTARGHLRKNVLTKMNEKVAACDCGPCHCVCRRGAGLSKAPCTRHRI